jgi:hypothetical protein
MTAPSVTHAARSCLCLLASLIRLAAFGRLSIVDGVVIGAAGGANEAKPE